jgi:hypothetical protein
MKHLFNFPQKKGKKLISYPKEKVIVELNEIKIKNFQLISDNIGYFIDCNIPSQSNTSIIEEIDNDAKQTLIDNYDDWFNNNNDDDEEENKSNYIEELYRNSYCNDGSMVIIISNKVNYDFYLNNEMKEPEDLIDYLNKNKKNKNCIINIHIVFLGMYINKTDIINKWALKYISIEDISNDTIDWNKEEIEELWEYDIITFEEEVDSQIKTLKNSLNTAKELYKEIKKENNYKNWENKIAKLKNIILKYK